MHNVYLSKYLPSSPVVILPAFSEFDLVKEWTNTLFFFLIIGHYLDQKRLKQGLYRHPWDDISYVLPEHMSM